MAHPVFWPSKTFFYPVGNTTAFSFTQDLSPEQSASILLLGCGDPRHILFTLHTDVTVNSEPRSVDFTCCDLEPAILARNILLFTLVEDKTSVDLIWNVFFHFKIDKNSLDLLTKQSSRLYQMSSDASIWDKSSYGAFIKFLDARTLSEVRRHWKLYAYFPNLPVTRLDKLRKEQTKLSKTVAEERGANRSPSRTAGIFSLDAFLPTSNLFKRYWQTGTVSLAESGTESQGALKLNPTFVYCQAGEVFDPHYGTFPQGFHIAPAMAPFNDSRLTSDTSRQEAVIVDSMKTQFRKWTESFRMSRVVSAITIRFYSGDAIAFCRALDLYAATSNSVTGVFVGPWRGAQINFDEPSNKPTPTAFDVIDTSNLTDHLGLLNILLATQPLLKKEPASQAILYTETLLPAGEDATKSFLDRVCTTIPTLSVLLGLAPRAYVSGFNSHSNSHELMYPDHSDQYHERVAWVDPSSGDIHARQQKKTMSFNTTDLAHVIFGFYDKMFDSEQVLANMFSKPSLSKLHSMSVIHYHRETVGALAQLIKRRIRVRDGDWETVADRLLEFIQMDRSRPIGVNNYQDLCLQLHLFGVYTSAVFRPDWQSRFGAPTPAKVFRGWSNVPAMLCVVLTVPRKSLGVLLKNRATTGTPTLQCNLTAQRIHGNIYSAIHPIWGKCVSLSGSDKIVIQEDEQGIHGSSDLVVLFWASSRILEFEDTLVSLAIKSTPQSTMIFVGKLGMELAVFSAKLDDTRHVRLLTYLPATASGIPQTAESMFNRLPSLVGPTERSTTSVNTSNASGSRHVISFTARIEINSPKERKLLLDGADVAASQTSPCAMKLSIADHVHVVSYSYPILGDRVRVRIARKSHYIELIAPLSEPLDAGGYHLNPAPVLNYRLPSAWNIHRISLAYMPLISLNDPKELGWLNPHMGLQFSDRERVIVNGDEDTKAKDINTLTNVKETIHALAVNVSGVQRFKTRAIGLCEPDKGGIYTILLVGALRFDLSSSTVLVDCAVVPLFDAVMPMLRSSIQILHNAGSVARVQTRGQEMVAWKTLLPAYVERCRTWPHKANCEYTARECIPLSTRANENPICSCGQGVGFDSSEWKIAEWKGFIPFATRAAISPLFAVSYLDTVGGVLRSMFADGAFDTARIADSHTKQTPVCWFCGGTGKPDLAACSRCKMARYCSTTCQHQDWQKHKKDCPKL